MQSISTGYVVFAGKQSLVLKKNKTNVVIMCDIIAELSANVVKKRKRRDELRQNIKLINNPSIQQAYEQFRRRHISMFYSTDKQFDLTLAAAISLQKGKLKICLFRDLITRA